MNRNTERSIAWTSTIVTCLFVGWTAATQTTRITPFEALFSGLGAVLPTTTRIVIAASQSPIPVLAGCLVVIVLVTKEFIVRNKWYTTCLNLCAFILVDGLSRFADYSMGLPMIDLIRKVG